MNENNEERSYDSGQGDESGGESKSGPLAAIRRELAEPFIALQFLTSTPTIVRRELSTVEVGRSMTYFPVVGLALGLTLGLTDLLFISLLPLPLASAWTITLMLLFTRALHLDGLMDAADGLFGGWTPERRLAIMRDSRIGGFGALAAGADLLLRFAALATLTEEMRIIAIVVSVTLGRWALVFATWAFPYARPDGMGSAFKRHFSGRRFFMATFSTLALLIGFGSLLGMSLPLATYSTIVVFGLALVVAFAAGRFVRGKLPGQTGDTYGATNELVEIAVLTLFLALQKIALEGSASVFPTY